MGASAALHKEPRVVEIESLEQFDRLVSQAPRGAARQAGGPRPMDGWHFQSVDLTERTHALRGMDPAGAVFLGCDFGDGTEDWLHRNGALIFPTLPGVPFDPYRGQVYTASELYDGLDAGPYEATLDAQVYAWASRSVTRRELDATLAASLHDHAIGDAMEALFSTIFAGRRMVGVMGGHAAARGSATYDGAARLGRLLAKAGYAVATGGGPGAMEAANLGAYLSEASDGEFAEALDRLAQVPGFRPSVTDWARTATDILAEAGTGVVNLGIPTWHYGHEPPNLFATHIAKYLGNAVREAVLLQLCNGGIVFLPGAGGTVQEIFQDACENYYATPEALSPMVLVGHRYWTEQLPAWPLLQALARGRDMERAVHLVDTVDEALQVLPGMEPES